MKPSLLIIDDEPNIAEFVGFVGDEMGFEVRITTTTEAFQQSYMKGVPSAIIMDVVMPGLDGIELLHLAQHTELPGSRRIDERL